MKQVLLERGAVTLHDVPMPTIRDHEVLVVVSYSYVDSGTQRSIEHAHMDDTILEKVKRAFYTIGSFHTHRYDERMHDTQQLGISCSGQVIAVGASVTSIAVGDWVACAGAQYGMHAEMVAVSEHLVAVLSSKSYIRPGSIAAIGARALHALRCSHVQFGEYVAVVGLGLLGQLTIQLARLHGCSVIALDIIKSRRDIALACGADRVYDAQDEHLVAHVMRATRGAGVDTVCMTATSHSSSLMDQAAMMSRKRGRIIVAGDINVSCDRKLLTRKEIEVMTVDAYGPGHKNAIYTYRGVDYHYPYVRWTAQRNLQAFIHALEHGKIHVDELITHEYELDEVDRAYQQVMRKTTVGVLLKYRHEEHTADKEHTTLVRLAPSEKQSREALRIGVLGVGHQAEHRLLPVLSDIPGAHIATLVDPRNTHVYIAGREYAADYVATDPSDMVANRYVEALAIDDVRYMTDTYVLHQIEHGIGVFLTHLPRMNTYELDKWRTYARRYTSIPLCVNLHRSFSSHIQKMAHVCQNRDTPIMAYYRMVVNEQPCRDEPYPFINYVAQAVDVFTTIVQSQIRSFSVVGMHAPQFAVSKRANCIIYLTCYDGSMCTLHITSLGAKKAGAEYLEATTDGMLLAMDNFSALHGYGVHISGHQHVFDDGYARLVRQFFEHYGTPSYRVPMSFDHLIHIAEVTMGIEHQLYTNHVYMDASAQECTSLPS